MTEIFMYVAGQTFLRMGVPELPEFMRESPLSDYRAGLLATLKRDIYNSRLKHRQRRDRVKAK